ncbi:hypothetical protein [Gallaecimonas mangrovi]|uniref:hypothetical protein n=1 Tax=Gallaecimonas mangrovi TaxID=2291597 RepID=UPI000E20370D|nr:hypothetical protein [Gallaecimonas mangrovi]
MRLTTKTLIIALLSLLVVSLSIHFYQASKEIAESKKTSQSTINTKLEKEQKVVINTQRNESSTPKKIDKWHNTVDKNKKDLVMDNLDNAISSNNNSILFNTQIISRLSIDDLRQALDKTEEHATSQSAADNQNTLYSMLTDSIPSDVNIDKVACSDKVCGLIISATKKDEITSTLSKLTQNKKLKKAIAGGMTKDYSGNGIFYGSIIGVSPSIGKKMTLQ